MHLLICAVLVAATSATNDGDWTRVQQLKHGTEVIVTLQAGAPQRLFTDVNRVVAASDADLILAPSLRRMPVIRVARQDIASVTIRRVKTRGSPLERARGAFLGFLLTAVGAAGGGTGPNFCTEHPHGCLPVSLLGGVAGGIAAYFAGKSETIADEVLIYRAPRV